MPTQLLFPASILKISAGCGWFNGRGQRCWSKQAGPQAGLSTAARSCAWLLQSVITDGDAAGSLTLAAVSGHRSLIIARVSSGRVNRTVAQIILDGTSLNELRHLTDERIDTESNPMPRTFTQGQCKLDLLWLSSTTVHLYGEIAADQILWL